MKSIFSFIAGVLFVLGFVPYIRAILRGETKPQKASWIIWGTLDTLTLAAMLAKHAVNGQIVGAVLGSWVVVALAVKYGQRGWNLVDKYCLAGAAIGIILWKTFNDPVLAIIAAQAATFTGSVPTFKSAWRNPALEDKLAWTIYWFSCVFAVIAMPALSWKDSAQPIDFFLIETIMMYILYIRSRRFAAKPEVAVH